MRDPFQAMGTYNKKNHPNSSGQTLIETLAALFILVMGVTAAVGLAVYAFASSTSIVKQVIATGLAREGIEAVRNMRDTNWLKDTLASSCYDYTTGTNTANCYPNWITLTYCLDPTNNSGNDCNGKGIGQSFYLSFDTTAGTFWSLEKKNPYYGLTYNDPNVSSDWKNLGFYSSGGNGINCSNSASLSSYCRKISITNYQHGNNPANEIPPYDKDANLSLLKVVSQVWWTDKKCPISDDWPGPGKCSVELDSYLTNWKNY